MPIHREDEQYFGPLMLDICEKKLLKDKDGWWVSECARFGKFWIYVHRYQTHPNFLPYPPRFVSIRKRATSRDKYKRPTFSQVALRKKDMLSFASKLMQQTSFLKRSKYRVRCSKFMKAALYVSPIITTFSFWYPIQLCFSLCIKAKHISSAPAL